jgi:hypothetical protein
LPRATLLGELRSGVPAIDIVEALQHVHNRLLVKEKARPYTLTIGPGCGAGTSLDDAFPDHALPLRCSHHLVIMPLMPLATHDVRMGGAPWATSNVGCLA